MTNEVKKFGAEGNEQPRDMGSLGQKRVWQSPRVILGTVEEDTTTAGAVGGDATSAAS